jgi:predicted SAM-dependent methyltransferase
MNVVADRCVCADLRNPIPLPDNTVDRIHSEDFMEHVHHPDYPKLLKEIHRVLKPGGRARMAMPDYGKQGLSDWSWQHHKEEFPDRNPSTAMRTDVHRTLTNYALLKKYTDSSPFKTVTYLQYADNTVPGINSLNPASSCPRTLSSILQTSPFRWFSSRLIIIWGW